VARGNPAADARTVDLLLEAARRVRANAYAPYSGYRVGSAVLGADGEVYTGVNVENAAYPASRCAEQSAVQAMVTAGCRELIAVAVVTAGERPGAPCGVCRQVMAEFGLNALVVLEGSAGERVTTSVAELLPQAFNRTDLE